MPKFNVHILIPVHTLEGIEADSAGEAIVQVWDDQVLTAYRNYSNVPYRVVAEKVEEDDEE